MITKIALIGLVGFGVWSGGRLSYQHYLSGEACPILGAVPACYVAFAGYLMMAAVLVAALAGFQLPSWLFWSGLAVAGGLALLGSVFELVKGNICPRAFGWLPMCYVSLAFSIAIGILYSNFTRMATAVTELM